VIEQQMDDSCPGAPPRKKAKTTKENKAPKTPIRRQKKTTKNKEKSKGKELP
jgi:hypothetical protein